MAVISSLAVLLAVSGEELRTWTTSQHRVPLQVLHPLLAACSPHPCFLKDTNPPGSACKAKFPRQLRPFHIHCGVPGPSPTAVPSKLTSGPRALAGRAVAWGWWQQLHPGPMLGATLSGPTADFPLPTIPTPGTKEVFQAAKKSYAGSSFET